MNKLFRNSIPFLMLAIALIAGRLYLWNSGYDDREELILKSRHIDHAVVIIGDSKSQFAFNDQMLSEATGNRFYNLSIWANRPRNNYELLDEVEVTNSIVFLPVSARVFVEADTVTHHLKRGFLKFFNFNMLENYRNEKNKSAQGRWEFNRQECGSLEFTEMHRPYAAYAEKRDSTHHFELLSQISTSKTTNIKEQDFSMLVQKLKANNNTVVLIDLPERCSFDRWINTYENKLHQDIEARTQLAVTDFECLSSELFYDSHHLNKDGAKVFTEKFITQFGAQLR
jgi:hypothetical protein